MKDEWLDAYLGKFRNRPDAYYVQRLERDTKTDKLELKYSAVYEPFSLEILRSHMSGTITVGIPALGPGNTCKWGCWDFDTSDGAVARLVAVLEANGLHGVREGERAEFDGSVWLFRDGHVWLLLDQPVPAEDLILVANDISKQSALQNVEFFPKQTKESKLSNPVRGPLGVHRKPKADNAIGWFKEPPRTIDDQLEWLAALSPNDSQIILRWASELRALSRFTVRRFRKAIFTGAVDPVQAFSELNPILHPEGGYYTVMCPSCRERTAFVYANRGLLICNGKNKCQYKISAAEWAKQHGRILLPGEPGAANEPQRTHEEWEAESEKFRRT